LSKLFTVAVLTLFVWLVRASVGDAPAGHPGSETALILGFLLLAAYLTGGAVGGVGLPKVTGYILLGLLIGPGVLGLVTESHLERFEPINDIAISLIALSAGGELRLRALRDRIGEILGILGAEMVAVFAAAFGLVLSLADVLPFTAGQEWAVVVTIAFVFGSIAIANSPSVTIAVINDTRSRGPVSSTMLSVTVAKDVIVVVAFAIAISFARSVLGDDPASDGALLPTLLWEVGGSLVLGAVSGWLISQYLRRVAAEPVLFILAVAFLNAQVAAVLHMEALLLSLVAGMVVENVDPERGDDFVEAIEANSLVFYALFFALAGAHIDPVQMVPLLPIVAAFVLVRAAAVWLGTGVGARLTGAPEAVRKYAWVGFISQAGVTLGMVSIVSREFPAWGSDIYTLFLAMVAVHELVGPVLLQWGLARAGEVGARDRPSTDPTPPTDIRSLQGLASIPSKE